MSSMQRGLWTFLLFTLVGPFFAAVGVALALPVLISLQLGPFAGENYGPLGLAEPGPADITRFTAMMALRSYVWAAIPAAVAGVAFAVVIIRGWYAGWGIAGSIGVFGFMIAALFMHFEHGGILAYIAVFAGFVAIACRAVAVRAGIVVDSSEPDAGGRS